MSPAEKLLFAMLRNEIGGEKLSQETVDLMTAENLNTAFEIAVKHDIVHLFSDALIHSGKFDPESEFFVMLSRKRMLAVYRVANFEYECDRIAQTFERHKIPFIFLKGSVLRDLYKESWMRTSCDIDVLVKVSDLENAMDALKKDLKYYIDKESWHDISIFAPSYVHIELHFGTIDEEGIAANSHKVLGKIWKDAKRAEGSRYRYELSPEMFYFYHVAHMVQHFQNGGCGIRPFIDLYILEKLKVDTEKLDGMFKKASLDVFLDKAKELTDYWMKNDTSLERSELESLSKFVISGGVYGTLENQSFLSIGKKGKFRSAFELVFLPYGKMRLKYNVLKRHRYLLPFFWVYRICESAIHGRGFKNFDIVTSVKGDDVDKATDMMNWLDLK